MKSYITSNDHKQKFINYVIIVNLYLDDLIDVAASRRISGDGSVYIEYNDGTYFYADETEAINLVGFT